MAHLQVAALLSLLTGWNVLATRKSRGSADLKFVSPSKITYRSVKALVETLGELPEGLARPDVIDLAALQGLVPHADEEIEENQIELIS